MPTVGELSDKLWDIREQRRLIAAQDKQLTEEAAKVESELLEAMKQAGIESGRGGHATFTRTESILPNVENWDAFYSYISRNKYLHLLERRPAVKACRELFEKNGAIPGVVPFTKVSIRLTTRSDT